MRRARITVLGGGSWGTSVASISSRRGTCTLWARDSAVVDEINAEHRNSRFLPDARLPSRLTATTDLAAAVSAAEVLVVGIPSQSFRDVLIDCREAVPAGIPVISLTKGLEQGTVMRMTEVITEVMPGHPAGVLTGPNLAREVIAGYAAARDLDMHDQQVVRHLQRYFHSRRFRVYTHQDEVG